MVFFRPLYILYHCGSSLEQANWKLISINSTALLNWDFLPKIQVVPKRPNKPPHWAFATYKNKKVNTSRIYDKQTHPEHFLYTHVVYTFNVVLSNHKQIPSPTFLFYIEEYKKTICALLCVGIYKGTKKKKKLWINT